MKLQDGPLATKQTPDTTDSRYCSHLYASIQTNAIMAFYSRHISMATARSSR